jgi:Transposase DDE domain
VVLEESPQWRLHAKLADAFQGSGGRASSAPVKIAVLYARLQPRLHERVMPDGGAAAQGRAAAMVPHLRAGALVIRDWGYLSLEARRQIAPKQAWFLSRLSNSAAVYPSADETVAALELVDHGQRHAGQHAVVDLAVYGGPARLRCRFLADRLPEEIVEQRRRSAYETARQKGRTPTQAYIRWWQFGWYITHVSSEVWAAAVVETVDRLRGQSERLFKQWKSLLPLHVRKGTRPERSTCLLYGRLIPITLLRRWSSYAAWYAAAVVRRALSFPKLMLWLKRKGRFAQAMHDSTWETLGRELRRDMAPLLCKPKRKRRTSQQVLEESRPSRANASQEESMLADKAA